MAFEFYRPEDRAYAELLPEISLLDMNLDDLKPRADVVHTEVYYPNEEYGFLHEAAVIEYHGTLFASWYNNPVHELNGRTPIRGRRSSDGGRTWSEIEVLCDDESGKIMYCPPVYGIDNDVLYMLVNEMVSADHIHALNLYRYDEERGIFEKRWSRPIPFKLNTNVCRLPNGRLMLPGRIAEMDSFPNTPAVLISDSGRIDAEWRMAHLQKDGKLADGSSLVHPEISAMIEDGVVYMFCRNDERRVPLMYISRDCAETWEGPFEIDLPFSSSKIYAGDLSDGRHYVIGNLYPGRSRLAVFFAQPGSVKFTEGFMLQDAVSSQLGYGEMWHYPAAYEADGKLYVIYTASVQNPRRGAVVSAIPL